MLRWLLTLGVVLTGMGLGFEERTTAAPAPKDKLRLRILVLTSASTREYQFLRTVLVREAEKNKVELKVVNQSLIGKALPFSDQDDRNLLPGFPERLQPAGKEPADRDAALGTYDVLLAIDPAWQNLSADQCKLVQQWVKQGGGLIVVSGPVHTCNLVRPAVREQLKPIADLYPVVLDDIRLTERSATAPWRLHFGKVKEEMKFMKLDPEGEGPLAGWEEFFTGKKQAEKGAELTHGFYTFYPVKSVKPGALVLATFADPKAKVQDQEQPYLATWAVEKGMVFSIGSGEVWRLRQHREAFHERFWTELITFASLGGAAVKP